MAFAEDQLWRELLLQGDEKALAQTAEASGFAEPGKTAANLTLLQDRVYQLNKDLSYIKDSFRTPNDPCESEA